MKKQKDPIEEFIRVSYRAQKFARKFGMEMTIKADFMPIVFSKINPAIPQLNPAIPQLNPKRKKKVTRRGR